MTMQPHFPSYETLLRRKRKSRLLKKNGKNQRDGVVANGHTQARVLLNAGWDPAAMKKKVRFVDRKLFPGLGEAVAKRTIMRKDETWGDVAERVALGNSLLAPKKMKKHQEAEYELLKKHIANASLLMSGRHLQHGDATQPTRNMEVFTNCSTASASFILFYLLLNGSGVGRAYDDDMS